MRTQFLLMLTGDEDGVPMDVANLGAGLRLIGAQRTADQVLLRVAANDDSTVDRPRRRYPTLVAVPTPAVR
jgi:hypothetical protein